MDNNLTVRIAQPPSVNASLSGPGTLYAKSLNYLDFVFSTGVETPNAIVKRDANGYANFTTARTVAGAAAIYATATGGNGTFAVEASGTNGSGAVAARSVSGVGALLTSGSGIGAQINSNTGSDIASFQNASATVFTVERVNGTLRWIKDSYSARLTPATLTATRTWTLPNTSGTVALTSDIVSSAIAATPNTLVLRNASGDASFGAINASSTITTTGDYATVSTNGVGAYVSTFGADAFISTSGTNASISTSGSNADIFTVGDDATISTIGDFAHISTSGTDANITTGGTYAAIYTLGSDALISTYGENAYIITNGENAHISTSGSNAYIQSRATFNLFNGTSTTTLSHSPTDDRAIAFPNTSGTIALINPSTGTQTFSGAQSFTGQVELTGQAATNATSAMTRALVDERVMPQAHLPSRFVISEGDFVSTILNTVPYGNGFASVGAPGGATAIAFVTAQCSANHPGVVGLVTGATANSGGGVSTSTLLPIVFGGGEEYTLIFKPVLDANTTRCRIGFAATIATATPNYIAYAEGVGDGAGNVVFSAITANFSGGTTNTTTNATTYSAALGVWYQMRVVVNASAASVSFYLYSESGTLLWSVTNSTNIPTSNVQVGFTFYNTTILPVPFIAYIDYHKFEINRILIR